MRWKPLLALLPLLLLCASSRRAAAQDEFLVNDDRIDRNQWAPRVALGANGTLLFVWMTASLFYGLKTRTTAST